MIIREIRGAELDRLKELGRKFRAAARQAEEAGLAEFTYDGSLYRKIRTGGWEIVMEGTEVM